MRLTDDGALPVVCVRPRGRGCLNYVMDLFSRVPIKSVRGAYRGEVTRLGLVRVVKSIRCAADELAYRVQLSELCEGNRGFTGVRSLLVRFIDGSTEVVSFYRIAHAGAGRHLKTHPETEEAIADRGLLHAAARALSSAKKA